MNSLQLEVMELSEYFNAIKNAKSVVHAKTDNIKVNNGARREKLLAQSEKILSDFSADARASAQSAIQELQSGSSNNKDVVKKIEGICQYKLKHKDFS